jgi:glucosamine--fructose-6-phosphate aminotransferase (isomerizing)
MPLLDEIFEQPSVIKNIIYSKRDYFNKIGKNLLEKDIQYIYLVGRGTSDNAGKYAQYLFGAENKLPIALGTPSLFSIYQQPPNLRNSLVIAISQSGKSPDIISVILEAKRQKCPTLVITNNIKSPLAELAEYVIDIEAGEEKAVAATKTYTATLVSIAMLSASLSNNKSMFDCLMYIPDWAQETLRNVDEIFHLAENYTGMENCVVLGRGYNHSTIHEWSLKLTELANILAEPYSTADFLHGPISKLKNGYQVFTIAPTGLGSKPLLELLKDLIIKHNIELLSISNQDDVISISKGLIKISKNIPEFLSPIVSIIPAQLFTYQLTHLKGLDTDNPQGLKKITETY